jgi:hypothetical protein
MSRVDGSEAVALARSGAPPLQSRLANLDLFDSARCALEKTNGPEGPASF